jgi:ubiquinol-cytochrome c reductase cytochrome c subunit
VARRIVRPAASLLAVWLLLGVLAGVLTNAVGPAGAQEAWEDETALRGGGVYQATCAACHGTAGLGGVGHGVERGPPIVDLPLPYVDQTLRTGFMPIAEKRLGIFTERLTDADREALLAYLRIEFGLAGEIPTVGDGVAARGQELYVRNCAACHGAHGTGGIVGGGTEAPALDGLDPVAVAEAIRVGPREMPAFEEEVLDQQQLDDVLAYLAVVDDTPRTPLGLREVNDVTAALAAVGLAAVVLVVVRRLAGRRDRRPPPTTAPGGGTWS